MAAVPSIGRARGVSAPAAPEADATRALYERYANQIFGYCLHQLGSREEAEDAVQSTFLNAFRGLRRGVVPEQEQAWLFKIAHNVCLSRRRSSWRRGRIESPADFQLIEETAPSPSTRGEELMGLQDVLEALPENQRRAILLREWQGLSYREVADELGVSQAAVETLIFRARRALAQGLETAPADQRSRRTRLRRPAFGLGNLVAAAKSLLAGGAGAKVVGAAALVAAASAGVVGSTDLARHGAGSSSPRQTQRPALPAAAGRAASGTAANVASPAWNDARPAREAASAHAASVSSAPPTTVRGHASAQTTGGGHSAEAPAVSVPMAPTAPAAGATRSAGPAPQSTVQSGSKGRALGKATAPGQTTDKSHGQSAAGNGSANANGNGNGKTNGQANGKGSAGSNAQASGQANAHANSGAGSNAPAAPSAATGAPPAAVTPASGSTSSSTPAQTPGPPAGAAPGQSNAASPPANPGNGQANGQTSGNGRANG